MITLRSAAVAAALSLLAFGSLSLAQTSRAPAHHRTNPARAEKARWLSEGRPDADGGASGANDEGDGGGTVVDGQDFWWLGVTNTDAAMTSTSAVVNNGVQAVLPAIDLEPDGGCFDCWTSDMLDNKYWGQVGWSACGPSVYGPAAFTTFYQIWDVSTYPGNLLVDGESTVVTTGQHTYTMSVDAGTIWSYSVDGYLIGAFDMGSATASTPGSVATLCEEGDGLTAAFVPPLVSSPQAMAYLSSNAWRGAAQGWVYNTNLLSGANGNAQSSAIPVGAMVLGGDTAIDSAGTAIWNGASSAAPYDAGANANAPPLVMLTNPAALATVSGLVDLAATVSAPSGTPPAGGVQFFVESADGTYNNQWTVTASPYTQAWDTTEAPNQQIYVTAQEYDSAGNTTYVGITVTVDNSNPATSTAGATTGSGGATGTSTGASSSGTSGAAAATSATTSTTTTTAAAATGSSGAVATSSSTGESTTAGAEKVTARTSSGCASGAGPSSLGVLSLALLLGWSRRRRTPGRAAPCAAKLRNFHSSTRDTP